MGANWKPTYMFLLIGLGVISVTLSITERRSVAIVVASSLNSTTEDGCDVTASDVGKASTLVRVLACLSFIALFWRAALASRVFFRPASFSTTGAILRLWCLVALFGPRLLVDLFGDMILNASRLRLPGSFVALVLLLVFIPLVATTIVTIVWTERWIRRGGWCWYMRGVCSFRSGEWRQASERWEWMIYYKQALSLMNAAQYSGQLEPRYKLKQNATECQFSIVLSAICSDWHFLTGTPVFVNQAHNQAQYSARRNTCRHWFDEPHRYSGQLESRWTKLKQNATEVTQSVSFQFSIVLFVVDPNRHSSLIKASNNQALDTTLAITDLTLDEDGSYMNRSQ